MMNLVPIFSKVVLGAAEASLDVAGAALLPGAWPILKGALEPVLERLKERLGGENITASPERAQKAFAEFEADGHLQEMLRSKLLEQLETLVEDRQKIEEDVQKLMLIVTGDQQLLTELVGGIERFAQRLDAGVNLSDEAVEKLAHAVSCQAENSRRIRALALREMGPVAQLIERQVHRLQVRAVELVQEGALDRATDELQEGLLLIAALLNEAPTDMSLRLQLGFIYKTISQVCDAAGQAEQAQTYIHRAEEVFRFVSRPSHLPASTMMTKTYDAHEMEIEGEDSRSLGIQFLGLVLEPQHLWRPGEYTFALYGWVNSHPGHAPCNVRTRFRAAIGVFEANQVQYWSSATKTTWDQLHDPDRAVGIPVRIDTSSIVAL